MRNQIQYYEKILLKKFQSEQEPISEKRKSLLKRSILQVDYPFSLNNILFYINKATANKLAASSHPLLKKWGILCQNFYLSDSLNQYVLPETGVAVPK